MTKNSAIDAAYDALEGRIGSGHDDNAKAELVRWVCEAYVRTEDALAGDEFDGDDYELPKAAEALVKQRDNARDEYEALAEELATLFGLEGERRTGEHIVTCAKEALRQLRRDR